MKKVEFLNVGHADCSIIQILQDSVMKDIIIIDVPNAEILKNELKKIGCKHVSIIVITHSDLDHSRGCASFLDWLYSQGGKVDKIVFNLDRSADQTRNYSILLKSIYDVTETYSITIIQGVINHGEKSIEVYNNYNERISIISPNYKEYIAATLKKNTNNMSIVCLAHGTNSSVLFPGDLESEGWKRLFSREPALKCNILKLPHHGAWLDATYPVSKIIEQLEPCVAIVSSSENRYYRHPSKETLDHLLKKRIGLYCTQLTSACCVSLPKNRDCCGNITICESVSGYKVVTEHKSKNALTKGCFS